MKKIISKLAVAIMATAFVFVIAPNTVKADECKPCAHDQGFDAYYKGGNQHEFVCRTCGERRMEGCERNTEGYCRKCGDVDWGYRVEHGGAGNVGYNPAPCYNPYWCYAPYYAYNPVAALEYNRAIGNALPTYSLVMTCSGIPFDIAAIGANAQDSANQLLLANTSMAALGFTNITTSRTYAIASYLVAAPYGVPQMMTWNNCGLTAGDTAYVIYWNPTKHAQLLPVTVGANGSANFIVPDVNGAQITLVKVNK